MSIIKNTITLSRKDCGERMETQDVKPYCLEMLDALIQFCDVHNLRYYMSGGTLLGAVRHKGFIPWDDDIDINMPRPDLEKLLNLCNGKLGRFTITRGGEDFFSPSCQWTRIYNEDIINENFFGGASDTESFFHPLFLDIFPIDGYPDTRSGELNFCRKLKLIRHFLGVSWHDRLLGKNWGYRIAHMVAFIPAKAVGYKRWCKLFQSLAQRYDFDKSKYIGVTTVMHYLGNERVLKSEYIPIIKMEFEGRMLNAPKGYDIYLSQLYGDYMQLPPVEKRCSDHKFILYHRNIHRV